MTKRLLTLWSIKFILLTKHYQKNYRNFTIVSNKFLQVGLYLDLEGQSQRGWIFTEVPQAEADANEASLGPPGPPLGRPGAKARRRG
jgi:hypothetical protein